MLSYFLVVCGDWSIEIMMSRVSKEAMDKVNDIEQINLIRLVNKSDRIIRITQFKVNYDLTKIN